MIRKIAVALALALLTSGSAMAAEPNMTTPIGGGETQSLSDKLLRRNQLHIAQACHPHGALCGSSAGDGRPCCGGYSCAQQQSGAPGMAPNMSRYTCQ
jgi:hypothetical protein